MDIIKELLNYFWKNKLWWLIPMLLVLLIVSFLLIFAQSSYVAPFIYVLF
jgi:competence protein ComGC